MVNIHWARSSRRRWGLSLPFWNISPDAICFKGTACVFVCTYMCVYVRVWGKESHAACLCVCAYVSVRERARLRERLFVCVWAWVQVYVFARLWCERVRFRGSCLFFGCVCAWHISFHVRVLYNTYFIFSNTTHTPTTANDNAEVHVDQIFDNRRCIAPSVRNYVCSTTWKHLCRTRRSTQRKLRSRPTIITRRVVYLHYAEHRLMYRQYIPLQ